MNNGEIDDRIEAASRAFTERDPTLGPRALRALTAWLTARPYRVWHAQLTALLQAERWDLLLDCFSRDLPFGTGGLRGTVGVGPNRFNPHTFGAAIQGHARWLRGRHGEGPLTLVVGYDIRRFDDLRGQLIPGVPNPVRGATSRDFARIAAEIYAAAGITVVLPPADEVLSTPELSFAIRALDAHGGLQVTASHNHPDDNGAKLYGATGGQLVPPHDEAVAAAVASVEALDRMSFDRARAAGLIQTLPNEVVTAYQRANLNTALQPTSRSARVVFSALHGTGARTVMPVLQQAGFSVLLEPTQAAPDGAFPEVPFQAPNPELPSALDAAIRHGERTEADLVLACDPDADRIGLAARNRPLDPTATDPARWRVFNGNEIAALVAHHVLRSRPGVLYKTLVTSSLVSKVAQHHGADVVGDLLVGFKYIGAAMDHLEAKGELDRFALGVEESHGVLTSPALRDKDAAGAALALAELASTEKDRGNTLLDCLERLWDAVGYVANVQRSAVLRGADGRRTIAAIQASLRQDPPSRLGGRLVLRMQDHQDTEDDLLPIVSETDRASRDVLVFTLDGGARVVLRPSGTEPKTKVYVEVSGDAQDRGPAARRRIDREAQDLAEGVVLALLDRVGLPLEPWMLGASDLVSVEHKRALAPLLDELERRLVAAHTPQERQAVSQWLDRSLAPLGAGARRLVAGAAHRWLANRGPAVPDAIRAMFPRR